MTTAPLTPTRRSSMLRETPRWSFANLLSSEFTKVLTLRSTFVIGAVMVLISVGFSAMVASTLDAATDAGASPSRQAEATSSAVGASVSFAQLVIGVLVVLLITNEYATNMIQSTLVATPRRFPVLVAKTIVALVVTLVLSLLSSLLSFAVTSPILAERNLLAPMSDGQVFGSIMGSALYLAIVAVFSLMAGAIVKNSAAGIAIVAGVLFVLPVVVQLVDLNGFHPGEYMLGYAAQGTTMSLYHDGVDHLALYIGVTFAWLAVPAIAAFALFTKRDA